MYNFLVAQFFQFCNLNLRVRSTFTTISDNFVQLRFQNCRGKSAASFARRSFSPPAASACSHGSFLPFCFFDTFFLSLCWKFGLLHSLRDVVFLHPPGTSCFLSRSSSSSLEDSSLLLHPNRPSRSPTRWTYQNLSH